MGILVIDNAGNGFKWDAVHTVTDNNGALVFKVTTGGTAATATLADSGAEADAYADLKVIADAVYMQKQNSPAGFVDLTTLDGLKSAGTIVIG